VRWHRGGRFRTLRELPPRELDADSEW